MVGWQHKYVDRGDDSPNDKVEVERPAPCRRRSSKSAPDNWSQPFNRSAAEFITYVRGHDTYTVPVPQVRPTMPKYIGRSVSVVRTDSKFIAPTNMPTPPTPQMTLPNISAVIEGAAPHIVDPTSNSITPMMNSSLLSNLVNKLLLNCC